MKDDSKVLVVSYHFPHYRGNALGAIRDVGVPVTYLGDTIDPNNSGVAAWEPDQSFDLVELKTRRLFRKLPILWQAGLLGYLRKNTFDMVIVYGHMYVLSYWLLAFYCRLRKIPCAIWTHGWRRKETGLKGALRKRFYRLFDAIVVFSDHARNIGREEGFDDSRIHVVYNSLNVALQDTIYQRLSSKQMADDSQPALFANEDPIVVCMTRLIPLREIPLLIEAAAKLQRSGKPVNLLIVGKGPEEENLRAMAKNQGVSAHFTGACYDEEQLAAYFMMSSLTVSPGPVGLLVMHSFIYGIPVLSNDDPADQGPEWYAIEPGENGDHFRRGDVESLCERIEHWCYQVEKSEVSGKCREVVLSRYNPTYQSKVFQQVMEQLSKP